MKRILTVRAKHAAEGEMVLNETHPAHPTHHIVIMGGEETRVGRSPAVEALLKTGALVDVDEIVKPAEATKPAGKDKV
jgi:hypothetical protein